MIEYWLLGKLFSTLLGTRWLFARLSMVAARLGCDTEVCFSNPARVIVALVILISRAAIMIERKCYYMPYYVCETNLLGNCHPVPLTLHTQQARLPEYVHAQRKWKVGWREVHKLTSSIAECLWGLKHRGKKSYLLQHNYEFRWSICPLAFDSYCYSLFMNRVSHLNTRTFSHNFITLNVKLDWI